MGKDLGKGGVDGEKTGDRWMDGDVGRKTDDEVMILGR